MSIPRWLNTCLLMCTGGEMSLNNSSTPLLHPLIDPMWKNVRKNKQREEKRKDSFAKSCSPLCYRVPPSNRGKFGLRWSHEQVSTTVTRRQVWNIYLQKTGNTERIHSSWLTHLNLGVFKRKISVSIGQSCMCFWMQAPGSTLMMVLLLSYAAQ